MLTVYVGLSSLAFLVFIGICAGYYDMAGYLLWWLVGTIGLVVLFCSSATFNPSSTRLPLWKLIGLLCGLIAGVPIIPWFASSGGWSICLITFVTCLVASYIIFAAYYKNRRTQQDAPSDGDKHPV
jgi:membrane protein implicated in regulation of membrane protease activity